MLRATKHLEAHPDRPFAALRVTREPNCHAEGNEASHCPARQTLRCAQGDSVDLIRPGTRQISSATDPSLRSELALNEVNGVTGDNGGADFIIRIIF